MVLAFSLLACTAPQGDEPASGEPTPLGSGLRLRDVLDPSSPDAPDRSSPATCGAPLEHPVSVSGVVVSWVDTFDETHDGKSRGTLYVQDYGASTAYSGISLYSPTFVPGDLRVAAGDVLDLRGSYQEHACLGSATEENRWLQQIAYPSCSFRFDAAPPTPIEIPSSELDTYEVARKWFGMLVTVKDVRIGNVFPRPGQSAGGRFTANFVTGGHPEGDRNAPGLSNELWALDAEVAPVGKHFARVTGIVTWFFRGPPKIATRSRADLIETEARAAAP